MSQRNLLLYVVLVTSLTLIVFITVLLYSYRKWKRLKASIAKYKRKIIKSIPHIEHPEYRRMTFSPLSLKEDSFDRSLAITLVSSIMSTYNISSKYDPLLPSNMKIVREILPNAVLYKTPESYILSFRGTMTAKDLIADFDISQTQFKGSFYTGQKDVSVHQGFYRIWETHKEGLKNALDDIEQNSSLVITGHSLGSALASYTALDYIKSPKNLKISLYVFAPPRVGNQFFIDEISSLIPNNWAHINVRDIVCDLPPSNCPTFTRTYLYDDFRRVYRSDYQSGEILSNHHIESYLNCLENKKVEGIVWNRPSKIYI